MSRLCRSVIVIVWSILAFGQTVSAQQGGAFKIGAAPPPQD